MKLTQSKKFAETLLSLGIRSPLDAVMTWPRRYDDFTPTPEQNLLPKQRLVLEVRLTSLPQSRRLGRRDAIAFPVVSKAGYHYQVMAFNQTYLMKTLALDTTYTLVGRYNPPNSVVFLTAIRRGVYAPDAFLVPVYPLPKTVGQHVFRHLIKRVYPEAKDSLVSLVPDQLKSRYRLLPKSEAVYKVHFPANIEDLKQGLRVLKYEEALLFSLKTALIRRQNQLLCKETKVDIDRDKVDRFIAGLPYRLTADQTSSVREIIADMDGSRLMYRILQGDVGSGKTLVAAIALYANHVRKDQGALMVPTDTLAKQHYQTLHKLFQGTGVQVALLVGSLGPRERQQVKDGLLDGVIDIVVGTHALFSDDIVYQSLGLAVVDEQHRFGVNQRSMLASKGRHADLLLMSATPIPRTLALTLYGEMDITSIKHFPIQKRLVTTEIVDPEAGAETEKIALMLEQKRQVFVIAPNIELEGENAVSVEGLFRHYQKIYGNKVALLHGRLASEDKDAILADFVSGRIPIIIATTVIEVGLDVPAAGLMIIYGPERFGLATLHQLRGRIGRDGRPATCVFMYDGDIEGRKRLEVLVRSDDGFAIAEEDLKFRGPGDLIGERQAGFPEFRFLNIHADFRMLELARDDAIALLEGRHDDEPVVKAALLDIDHLPYG